MISILLTTLLLTANGQSPSEQTPGLQEFYAALSSGPSGYFWQGGGYISHGQGAIVTWALNQMLEDTSLEQIFSDKIVSSSSGGGWFLNDLLYSKDQEWEKVILSDTPEEFVDRISEYYYKMLATVYQAENAAAIKTGTDNGDFYHLNIQEWTKLLSIYQDWEKLIVKYHDNYADKPTYLVENFKWISTTALAEHFNDYSWTSDREWIDEDQRSEWINTVPTFYDIEFTTPGENPAISVIMPAFDHPETFTCSTKKLRNRCTKTWRNDPKKGVLEEDERCPANSKCDTGGGYCVCDFEYHKVAGSGHQDDSCEICTEEDVGPEFSEISSVLVEWIQPIKNTVDLDPTAPLTINDMKEYIKAAIDDDPKKYSGPSSTAGAIVLTDSVDALGLALSNFENLEVSWLTPHLEKEFGEPDAPALSLIDGGGLDNCALAANVMKHQQIESSGDLLVGLCTVSEVLMLIQDEWMYDGALYPGRYEMFKFKDPEVGPQPIFIGKVMVLYKFEVITVSEPYNGVHAGDEFTIYAFSFPEICRNNGVNGECPSNYLIDPAKYQPSMSLLPGRGEVFELQIASNIALQDFTDMFHLMKGEETESHDQECGTGNTPIKGSEDWTWYCGSWTSPNSHNCGENQCCCDEDYYSDEWGYCKDCAELALTLEGDSAIMEVDSWQESKVILGLALVGLISTIYYVLSYVYRSVFAKQAYSEVRDPEEI